MSTLTALHKDALLMRSLINELLNRSSEQQKKPHDTKQKPGKTGFLISISYQPSPLNLLAIKAFPSSSLVSLVLTSTCM